MNSISIGQKRKNRKKALTHVLLIVFSFVFLLPFLWMMITSLKSMEEIYQYPPRLLPSVPYVENYRLAVTKMPFLRYLYNTTVITVLTVVGTVCSSSMVAYSMSKINWGGKKYLFPFIVATMMIPSQVTMIPLYIIYAKLQLVGTIAPLVVPKFLGDAYYIFLLRQFFKTIPDAYIESATIDGAGEGRIFVKIMLPLCKPALVSVAIFSFLNAWSDFMGPLLYLNSADQYTLSLGLQAFMQTHFVEWGPLMAASAIFTIPVIVLFFFAQKYFIEGITITGVKG
ncbi:MAG: carbohydrate ABC transporter permease [Clostridia bacterium]